MRHEMDHPLGRGVYEAVTLEFGSTASMINTFVKSGVGKVTVKGSMVVVDDGLTADVNWTNGAVNQTVEVNDWRRKPNGRGGDAWVNFSDNSSVHLIISGKTVFINRDGLQSAKYD